MFYLIPFAVIHQHGVIMDYQMDIQFFKYSAFNIVNHVVADEGVLLCAEFHMDRGKGLAGTIVMHQ